MKERTSSFWEGASFACFVIAFLAGLIGSLLTTAWILNEQLHPRLRGLGLILLMLSLPVFIAGGHCLDLRDRQR